MEEDSVINHDVKMVPRAGSFQFCFVCQLPVRLGGCVTPTSGDRGGMVGMEHR